MNSTTSKKLANIIIDWSIITLSSTNICITIGMLIVILSDLIKRRTSPHRVVLLLTANMYISLLFFSILCLEQYIHVLSEHIYLSISLNNEISCQIRAYFQWTSISGICYSNALQAIYRLCRIVLYKKHFFQSFKLYQIIILVQWISCFLMMFPFLFLGHFKYLNNYFYCQINYSNILNTLIRGTLVYGIPMGITIGCYIYTLKKIRKINKNLNPRMTQIQQIAARRDLVVLFRICLLVALLTLISIPAIISLIISNLTGYLLWWSTPLQWLVLIISVLSVTISLAFVSPHVRNLLRKTVYGYCYPTVAPANIRNN